MVDTRKTGTSSHRRLSVMLNAGFGFCALLITLLLALRFYLMLYFPGTEQTAYLFKLFLPQWKIYSDVCFLLKSPLLAFLKLVPVQSMAHLSHGLPEMPAATLMAQLLHQPLASCKALYPGRVEWLTLLAIPFWDGLLLALCLGTAFLRENMDLGAVLEESRMMISERRQARQIGRKIEALRANKPSPTETGHDSHETERNSSARTHERLSKSKSQSAPPLIVKPTMEDWEHYKQEQGDLMVNDMVRQLRQENASLHAQQDNLRSTFSKYFSPKVLRYLESNRGSFETVENEKHQISVLFCDIRGFSAYTQSASSDEVVSFLGEYFEIASQAILHRYDGVISKLIGDGLMAYWGFPVPTPDHAYIATRAALDILQQIDIRNHNKPNQPPLNIGIGIATGEAIVGNIGSSDFKDFTLIGAAVNMAARLEEANKTLKTRLLISEATYRALHGKIPCQDCGKIEIRGWQNKEQVYAPVIEKS